VGVDEPAVLTRTDEDGERSVLIETTATVAGGPSCGAQATGHGRSIVEVRDVSIGGRPVRPVWRDHRPPHLVRAGTSSRRRTREPVRSTAVR
jgi:hypothetical protein